MNIPLTQGKYALVDEADYAWLAQWKWHYLAKGYAARREYVDGKSVGYIYMHRAVMERKLGRALIENEVTDHINGSKLDNRTSNLRPCTNAENLRNRGAQKNNTSGAKGVYWDKQASRWRARIGLDNGMIYLGMFVTVGAASAAYNRAAIKYHGEFAKVLA